MFQRRLWASACRDWISWPSLELKYCLMVSSLTYTFILFDFSFRLTNNHIDIHLWFGDFGFHKIWDLNRYLIWLLGDQVVWNSWIFWAAMSVFFIKTNSQSSSSFIITSLSNFVNFESQGFCFKAFSIFNYFKAFSGLNFLWLWLT